MTRRENSSKFFLVLTAQRCFISRPSTDCGGANGGHGGFQQILMHAAQTNVKDEKNGADADHENHEARVILECR